MEMEGEEQVCFIITIQVLSYLALLQFSSTSTFQIINDSFQSSSLPKFSSSSSSRLDELLEPE